jgi:hypothetical protein
MVITLITIAALAMMVSTFIGAVVLIKMVPYLLLNRYQPAHSNKSQGLHYSYFIS